MLHHRTSALIFNSLLATLALPAVAADRVHAGQWEQTVNVAGLTITRPNCLSKADADAINGDAKSIKGYLEKLQSSTTMGCTVKDVKIDGNKVIVTNACPDGKVTVGTTTYHGDRYETENSAGTKSEGKWVGPCK